MFPDGRLGISNAVNVFLNPLATTTGLGGQTKYRDFYSLNTFRYRVDLPWITKGLYVDGFGSADFQTSNFKDFMKTWDVYRYDGSTGEYIPLKQTTSPEGLASLKQGNSSSRTYTVNVKINYTKVINSSHNINAFVAYEQQQFRDEYSRAFRRSFFTDNIDELDFGSTTNATNEGNGSNFARRNYFGRINYDYRGKYLIEVQARYDGSDKFSPEKRWGLFPSVSLGWRLSQESWMSGITGENELKIRGSWGLLGNDAISPYQFLQFYNLNPRGYVFAGQAVPSVSPAVLPNPNFTWEKARSMNLAVDGGLFKNRVTYTVEVFKQKRSDVLTRRISTVPAYTALVLPIENIGIVENKGIEGQLSYRNDPKSKFQYSIGGNITYVRNKIIFIDEPVTTPEYQKAVGQPINSSNIFIATGIFQSQAEIDKYAAYHTGQIPRPGDVIFKDINGDNIINGFDRTRVDLNNTPEIMYGITMNAQWKGFDMSVLFQGQARSRVFFYPQASSTLNFYRFLYEGRSTPDQITDKPGTAGDFFNRPQFQTNSLPFFRRNTAFLRLKNVELGYTVPGTLTQRAKLSNLRFYVNASNLLTFAHFDDVDPETLNRADGKGYPLLRTVNFGVAASF
jgi:TonB-linked SusC/RagA family outer membrane protein